jgi:hypothetical protein
MIYNKNQRMNKTINKFKLIKMRMKINSDSFRKEKSIITLINKMRTMDHQD